MTADAWYRAFYQLYGKDAKIQALENKKNLSDPEWTEGIREFLKRLAKSLDYQVTTEHKAHGNQRFDQTWSKPGDSIAIEYENDYTTVQNEVEKLCRSNSNIRVLITYVPDKNFLPETLNIANNCVAAEINKHIGNFNGEFLLIVGGYEWNDWAAIRFVLRARVEPIRL